MAVGLFEGPSYPGHPPHTNHFFAVLPSERPQKGSKQPLKNRSTVFSLLPLPCPSTHSSFSLRSRQHQQVCHFSFLTLALSSLPPFLLPQSHLQIWKELFSLSSCTIRLQWISKRSFLPWNDAADELARCGVLLVTSAIPCSLCPLTFRIHSSLFSDWRLTVSSKFFEHSFPRFSLRNL